jgi:hypothetical protein
MALSLNNLFRRLYGSTPAPRRPRRRCTTGLNVESLEERAVPATFAVVANHYYNFGAQGTLYVTSEDMKTGKISGYLEYPTGQSTPSSFGAASSFVNLSVTGQVGKLKQNGSTIAFETPSAPWLEGAKFQGSVANDGSTMKGTLSEVTSVATAGVIAAEVFTPYPEAVHGYEISQ